MGSWIVEGRNCKVVGMRGCGVSVSDHCPYSLESLAQNIQVKTVMGTGTSNAERAGWRGTWGGAWRRG